MEEFRLGLVIHGMHVPVETARIAESVKELCPMPGIRLTVALITEADWPSDAAQINICAAKNLGLRRLIPLCDGIACLDVDYLLPPGLCELLAYPALQPYHVWVKRRDIPPEAAPLACVAVS